MSIDYRPSASLEAIRERARLYTVIRGFFSARQVLEVETPTLCSHTVTEPSIQSLALQDNERFCQTSPEYCMKRLLACDSGSIYQITKSFRREESGRLHNPEFTMLEWYRPNFSHRMLMDEVAELIAEVFRLKHKTLTVCHYTYQEIFMKLLGVDPLAASSFELVSILHQQGIHLSTAAIEDTDEYLNLLMSQVIEPSLPQDELVFIDDFPASMASLARLNSADKRVAHRFECYYQGMELANGFLELTDAEEQRSRFEKDNQRREKLGLCHMSLDEYLLAALNAGMPNCAGVALGIDRLLMILLDAKHINEVIAFPWEHC